MRRHRCLNRCATTEDPIVLIGICLPNPISLLTRVLTSAGRP